MGYSERGIMTTFKEISEGDITKLKEPKKVKPDDRWPDPLQLMVIRDAVEAEKKTVVIDGRKFNIKYQPTRFFIWPQKGFAPCGWFEFKTAFSELQ